MKHPRLRKFLKWGSLGLLALVLILGISVWFLAGTQGGTEFLFTRLGAIMPGKLEVAEMKGPLRGPLDIQGLKYEREGFTAHVDRLHLEWRLRDLLSRQLDIQALHADGIRIITTPSEKEKERTPLPDVNLRFNIIVRDAKVRNMSFSSAKPEPGEKPFVIDSIDLETTAIQNNVRVDRLAVRSPTFNADVNGTVRPQGEYPVDLNVRWSLRLPDMQELGGQGKLSGTLEDLQVDQKLNAPFPVQASALLQDPLYDMRFDGRIRFSDANPRLLKVDLPDIPASGEVALKGSITDFTGIGTVEATLEQTGPVAADFQVTRDDAVWIVDRAAVALTGTPTRLTAEGRINTEGETPGFQGVAGWENLTWPLRGGAPVVASRRGTARIQGTAEQYDARVQADLAGLAGGKVPPGSWTIDGSGTQERFRFEELSGNLFGGRLTARGEVAWKPGVRWNATVRASGIDPGQLAEGFPGRLSLAARSQGRLEDAGPFGTVEISSIQGTLRGQPVQAVAGLRLAGSRHEITRLNATWSTAKLSAAGWVGDALDLRWTLDAPNLGIAVPQGAGAVTAQGRLSGPATTPRIQADARGADLRFGTQTISEVTAVADVNLAPGGTVVLDVTSRGIQSGERRVEELLLQGRGTRGNHTITASARNADGTLGLALAGGLTDPTKPTDWRGQIRQLDLRSEMTGDWSLTQPAPLAASTDAVQVQDFCWRSRGGQLCATGGWAKAGAWNVDSRVSDLSFDLFKTFLPPDLEITGQLNGTVQARGSGSVLASANVDLRPGPGEFRFPGQGGRTVAFRYEQGSVRAQAGAGGAGNATAHMTLVGIGTLDAQARLPRLARGVPLQGQPLSGRIDVQLNDIAFLEGFVPDLQSPKGALTAGYALAGTMGSPRLTGEARLANGSADVPRLGLELREIRLAAIGDGSGSLNLDVSARSGPGTLTMKGRTGLVPSKENPVQLAVNGQRFQAMDTEKIKVLVSPDLQVAYAGDLVRVTGDVVIPEADVEIKERGEKGPVKASEDVVFVNTTGEEPDARKDLQVATRVRLVLGRDVEVNLFGLEAKPTGSLLAVDEPGKVTRGVGELELKEGTFKAYGQDLTIERGRLVFAGPIDNPGVDIRAFRKADDGTVAGINAKGTARKPEVTLWSRPAMTESETLSYLLLGRPLNRAEPQEGDRLANAAMSLGIKGGNLLAKKLAARYGLEEARIESDDGSLEQASLVVGKYLSPRLYVGYGVGLFEAVNTFRIRYLINEKWNLQAESGEGTSADVLYTIERGK